MLDHAALVHGGDFNAREDAALTMRLVNHIAQQTGASVLLLAHSPKGAAGAEDSDFSQVAGSTAFVDQARCALILATMRKPEAKTFGIQEEERTKYVSMTIVKNNYGPTGSIHWFRRTSFDEVGLLEPENLVRPAAALKGIAAVEAAILTLISSNPGRYSKTSLRDTHQGINGHFKVSKATLQNAIENLLADKRLVQRPPTDDEKQQFALGSRVANVIVVPE